MIFPDSYDFTVLLSTLIFSHSCQIQKTFSVLKNCILFQLLYFKICVKEFICLFLSLTLLLPEVPSSQNEHSSWVASWSLEIVLQGREEEGLSKMHFNLFCLWRNIFKKCKENYFRFSTNVCNYDQFYNQNSVCYLVVKIHINQL